MVAMSKLVRNVTSIPELALHGSIFLFEMYQAIHNLCDCIGWFVSDLFGNPILHFSLGHVTWNQNLTPLDINPEQKHDYFVSELIGNLMDYCKCP